jgi:ketosteroid isomerase-like protein
MMASSRNIDLVRSIYAAWEQGDFSSAEWAHPEIEFVIADGPSPGSWTGLTGMAEGFRDLASTWERYRVSADGYQELDDERVLVLVRVRARGKTSGLDLGQIQAKAAGLFQFREGKVIRYVIYFDRDRALADLGLGPEARSPDS